MILTPSTPTTPRDFLRFLNLPATTSHKGQNGKLLIIGGSDLFHAASKWSLDVASHFVDMVFYSSVPANNELVKAAKTEFWNGIVVERNDLDEYANQADCILIGPGMTRTEEVVELSQTLWQKYPQCKWVIDAGALQVGDPHLFPVRSIITPHQQEWLGVLEKISEAELKEKGITIVLKGEADVVENAQEKWQVTGGNPGMTKGGTGDVLAGLIAALYCTHDALPSAIIGSYINKKAGESLAEKMGPFFNASELVQEIPTVLWREYQTLIHEQK